MSPADSCPVQSLLGRTCEQYGNTVHWLNDRACPSVSEHAVRRRVAVRIRRVRAVYAYTMRELAGVLRVHVRTAQLWHKAGLNPINPGERPMLFRGSDVREFLVSLRDQRRCRMRPDEIYCLKCKKASRPEEGSVRQEPTNQRIGRSSSQIIILGTCPRCKCTMRRFSTDKNIVKLQLSNAKSTKHQDRLCGHQLGFLFTDLEGCNSS